MTACDEKQLFVAGKEESTGIRQRLFVLKSRNLGDRQEQWINHFPRNSTQLSDRLL